MAHRTFSMKLAAVALAAPLLGVTAWAVLADETDKSREATVDQRAVEVLRQLSGHLAGLDAYSTTIEQSMVMQGPLGNGSDEQRFDLAVAKPNRIAARSTGDSGESMVSDGDRLLIHIPMIGAYVETDAPRDAISVMKEVQNASVMTGALSVGAAMPMLAPDGPDGELGTLQSASYRGETELDGTPVHHLSLVIVPELTEASKQRLREEMGENSRMVYYVDAWIGAGDEPRLHKLHFDLAKSLVEMMPDMLEFMPEMREMKYDLTMSFTAWQTGEDVSKERFAFKAPEDAEMHESLEKLVAAMLAPPAAPTELLGKPAPEFEAQLLDGATFTSDQHKGRDIVILDFWATWCGPCIQAMPDMMAVAEAYKDRNVVFYAINVQEQPETIESFIEQRNWNLQVPMDRDGSVGRKYMVGGIPQTVIIDKDGVVQAVHVGAVPKSVLEDELDTLLRGEKLVSVEADASE